MSSLSRRLLLGGIAALPTISLVPVASAENSDRDLLAAALRIEQLQASADALYETYEKLNSRYYELIPKKPSVLSWRVTDPVGYEIENRPNNKCRTWCNEEAIEEHRGKPCVRQEFIGTDEEWEEYGLPSNADIPKDIAHLWRLEPHQADQKRLDEITAAHDLYSSECEALRASLGINALQAQIDEIENEKDLFIDLAFSLPATTTTGMNAKARIIRALHGHAFDLSDADCMADRFLRQLCNEALAVS